MRSVLMLSILLPVLFSSQAAYGHAMHVRCRVEPPTRVVVDASWRRDEPVAQAAVTVFDANGDALLHGTTDATGRFECTVAEPQALIVEVVFAGHRGECEVGAAAFEGAVDDTAAEDPLLLESAMGEDDDHQHDHGHADSHHHEYDAVHEHAHGEDAHSHEHPGDDGHGHGHSHSAGQNHEHHGADDHDSEAGSHGHNADSHAHDDGREHAADDDHRAELLAGIALILSLASFLMVLSLRREVRSLVDMSRGNRS